jgi:hypothetical protein
MTDHIIVIPDSLIDWDFLRCIDLHKLSNERAYAIKYESDEIQHHEKNNAYSYLQLERCNHEQTKKYVSELQKQVELLQNHLQKIKHIRFKS